MDNIYIIFNEKEHEHFLCHGKEKAIEIVEDLSGKKQADWDGDDYCFDEENYLYQIEEGVFAD